MSAAQAAPWGVLLLALACSVFTDVRRGLILDAITVPTVVAVLTLRALFEGVGDVDRGLISGGVASAGLFAFYAWLAWRGSVGWGDAKLMAAVGAALGFPLALTAALFASLFGAAQALVVLFWKREFWDTVHRWTRTAPKLESGQGTKAGQPGSRRIPYGVAIALGTLAAMVWARAGVR